jgi:hypothetical protein
MMRPAVFASLIAATVFIPLAVAYGIVALITWDGLWFCQLGHLHTLTRIVALLLFAVLWAALIVVAAFIGQVTADIYRNKSK